jgi:hypothetical protein
MNTQQPTRKSPRAGELYTLEEITKVLYLRDSPALMMELDGKEGCVQNSHLSDEEILSVPGFAKTWWRFVRETHEWIPVFQWADSTDPREVVVVEPLKDDPNRYLWIVPKGFPRKQ